MKKEVGTYVYQGGAYLNMPYISQHIAVFTKISWFKKKMLKYFFGITYEKA